MVCCGHAKDLQTNFRLSRLGRALEAHDLHFGSEVNGVEVAGKLNIDGVDIAILKVPDIRLIPIRSNEAESIGGRNLFNDATLGSFQFSSVAAIPPFVLRYSTAGAARSSALSPVPSNSPVAVMLLLVRDVMEWLFVAGS